MVNVVNNTGNMEGTFYEMVYKQRNLQLINTCLRGSLCSVSKNIILNNKEGKIFFGSSTSQLCYNLANSLEEHISVNKNSEIILNDFNHEACLTPFERIGNWTVIEIQQSDISFMFHRWARFWP